MRLPSLRDNEGAAEAAMRGLGMEEIIAKDEDTPKEEPLPCSSRAEITLQPTWESRTATISKMYMGKKKL
ncbi:hypothetical protein SUGI_0181270 [Cryptomeria japonica]|nr:hypothetical protein SUGI_0181270 [Cryptomeria japonica]